MEHLQRVWHASRERLLPPDTWSYPIWDLHLFIKPKPYYLLVTLTEYDLFTDIYITELERFQQNICNGCGMPAGDADPSGHLVPSPILGLANAPIVETKFLELAVSLLDFSPRIPLGAFSIMLSCNVKC